ncbi:MAG: hypothetical protein JNJ77_15400 [Planctomycetia bacterium]|nr:hypothetical protein [Planctomycetia bacterium]
MKNGYFMNSGILFNITVSASDRLGSVSDKTTGGQNDALVAVLFAAATLEAFIMELAIMAEADYKSFGYQPLQSVASILNETENSRGSTRLKFLLAKVVLSGETFDKGSKPYQDFDTLFTLRDAIVHLKPEKITDEPQKILQRFRAMNLCENAEHGVSSSWLGQISTRAVAEWSRNVVVDMVESLKSCLPTNSEKTPLLSFLSSQFNRAE